MQELSEEERNRGQTLRRAFFFVALEDVDATSIRIPAVAHQIIGTKRRFAFGDPLFGKRNAEE
jgi:hypothetical protein